VILLGQVSDFPLKYLGVLLSISKKLPRHALQLFVDKVTDHLLMIKFGKSKKIGLSDLPFWNIRF
jgi:hypothetical protein